MPLKPTPVEIARRRASYRVLWVFVVGVASFWLARGLVRALTPPKEGGAPPRPLAVDLATDPAERLVLLPGIGPSRAASILADRRRHGPVASFDDLRRIHGIGPVTVERLRTAKEVRVVIRAPPLSARAGSR